MTNIFEVRLDALQNRMSPTLSPPHVPSRKPDAARRRQEILEAAFSAFSEKGYAGATLRDIATRAGVTHGLVRKYFGSKEELFLAAIPGTRDWALRVHDTDGRSLSARIAAPFVERQEAGTGLDVLVALLKSTSDADLDSVHRLYDQVLSSSLELYEPLIAGPDARVRSEILLSLLIGLTYTRHLMQKGEMRRLDNQAFSRHVAEAIGALIGGDDRNDGRSQTTVQPPSTTT